MSRIEKCQWGQLDQGMIFLGAASEKYSNCVVHGILITARCDFAHNSTSVCTYLPVVKLSDWLIRDFLPIASDKIKRIIIGKIRDFLKSNNYAPSVLDTLTPRKLYETLFFADVSSKRKQEAASKMLELTEQYEFIESASSIASQETLDYLKTKFHKPCNEIVDECIKQKLNGFYFLDSVEKGNKKEGFVVLLREVKSLPIELAIKIANGLDILDYKQLCVGHPLWNGLMDFPDFAFPLGNLRSPDIEHLMQVFTMLFGRIGIEDHEKGLVEKLWPANTVSDRKNSHD